MQSESFVRQCLSTMPADSVPMRMLFPDARYHQAPWQQRFASVCLTEHHWSLLQAYARNQRWLTLDEQDTAIFDYWLLNWLDYRKWLRSIKAPFADGKLYGNLRQDVLDAHLAEFLASADVKTLIPNLTSVKRLWLHNRATQTGLTSESVVQDSNEYNLKSLILNKPEGWTMPQKPHLMQYEIFNIKSKIWREAGDCIGCGETIFSNFDKTRKHWHSYCSVCSDFD